MWKLLQCMNEMRKRLPPNRSTLPKVHEPNWECIRNPDADSIHATWLGHATSFLQLHGFSVLTDPMFSARASPLSFAGPKRVLQPPCKPGHLPRVDLVLLSHNHYDHMDSASIKALLASHPHALYVVPLENGKHLKGFGVSSDNIRELDWWEQIKVERRSDGSVVWKANADQDGEAKEALTIVCTPAQHFSRRGLRDMNTDLWCSWALLSPSFRVFFAGDTGYTSVPRGIQTKEQELALNLPTCPAFREIGSRLGPFDLALLSIGAYQPRWFMSNIHLDPFDAVHIHCDLKAKRSLGIHWGTFVLTSEPFDEPPQMLRRALKHCGVREDEFVVLDPGQMITVKKEKEEEEEEKDEKVEE